MAIGIVKNFNKDKGFGFINMEGEERDIFLPLFTTCSRRI